MLCKICNKDEYKCILMGYGYGLWKCGGCVVVMTVGKFDDSQYQSEKELEKQYIFQKELFEDCAKDIVKHFPITSGKLLDIGCGLGWLVNQAQKMGFNAIGIDSGKACIDVGKKYLHANIKYCSLENFKSQEKFDLITLNHVLEHIEHPNIFLSKTKSFLKENGYIIVACPNINSLMFKIFRQKWYGLVPNQHRFQYSPKSLKFLLEKTGFKIEKVIINNLDYQVKSFKGLIFNLILKIADITKTGDQVIIIAKHE